MLARQRSMRQMGFLLPLPLLITTILLCDGLVVNAAQVVPMPETAFSRGASHTHQGYKHAGYHTELFVLNATRQFDDGERCSSNDGRSSDVDDQSTTGNITLVTHLTLDRWKLLQQWCKRWRGPISASVFMPPSATEQDGDVRQEREWGNVARNFATTSIKPLHDGDSCLRKHCNIHVVVRRKTAMNKEAHHPESQQQHSPGQGASSSSSSGGGGGMLLQYPFNVQRNAAIDGALGPLVFLIDIDLILYPDSSARERKLRQSYFEHVEHMMHNQAPTTSDSSSEQRHHHSSFVVVVPTIETVHEDLAPPHNVKELQKSLQAHEAVAFYGHYCNECHMPTNMRRFTSTAVAATLKNNDQQQSLSFYDVPYVERFEPYVIADKRHLHFPPYDERFIGRGFSKMSFFVELHHLRYRFVVFPTLGGGAFLAHTGRGNEPQDWVSLRYAERQRGNRALFSNFKNAVLTKAARLFGTDIENDHTRKIKQVAAGYKKLWGDIAASEIGATDACMTSFRPEDAAANATLARGLRALLHTLCNESTTTADDGTEKRTIDCSPIHRGGVRMYPDDIVLKGDWVFDRWFRAQADELLKSKRLKSGEADTASLQLSTDELRHLCEESFPSFHVPFDEASNHSSSRAPTVVATSTHEFFKPHFESPAAWTPCSDTLHVCVAKRTSPDEIMKTLLGWTCGEDRIRDCDNLVYPMVDQTKKEDIILHQYATVAFNRHFLTHRCSVMDPVTVCNFETHAKMKPLAELPQEWMSIPFTEEIDGWWRHRSSNSKLQQQQQEEEEEEDQTTTTPESDL